jgi:hypothetical protein
MDGTGVASDNSGHSAATQREEVETMISPFPTIMWSALGAVACAGTTRQPRQPPQTTTTVPAGPTQVNTSARVILVGQELDVRLQAPLSSETSTVEQRFEATTVADPMQTAGCSCRRDPSCAAWYPAWSGLAYRTPGQADAVVDRMTVRGEHDSRAGDAGV